MSQPSADHSDSLRASDADREAIVARLQTAFAEGRLDMPELDERMSGAYAAKTIGELKAFTHDLPPAGANVDLPSLTPPRDVAARPSEPRPQPKQQSHSGISVFRWGMPPIVLIGLIVWFATSDRHHSDFPWWIIFVIIWVAGGFGGRHRHRHRRH